MHGVYYRIRCEIDRRYGVRFGYAIADPEMVGLDWTPYFDDGHSVGIIQVLGGGFPAFPVGYMLFTRDIAGGVHFLDDNAIIEREGRYACTAGELCESLCAYDALAGGGVSVRHPY